MEIFFFFQSNSRHLFKTS